MQRIEALRILRPDVEDQIVVTIMGAVAAELYSLGHRPNFFYLEHAMGLASSMGLGLALSLPHRRVIVLDGDGSLLMNLGTLSTLGWYAPKNLIHVVFDNQSLLSVGGFPTATSAHADLAGIAAKAGIESAITARSCDQFKTAWEEALKRRQLSMIVAKVDATGPSSFHMDVSLLENRFQFQRWLRENAAYENPKRAD
ncbi:MAG TPA: thiamine pyrophosphate-dependent enzyme [Acidobacteriota bacterium]|nr:thiamine pyrophosphate-dependent enzyme [Acidobacteriota bacterium]